MAQLEVRFTLKGHDKETAFTLISENEELYLYAKDGESEHKIQLINDNGLLSLYSADTYFEESDEIVAERLSGLSSDWVEYRSQGFEGEGTTDETEVSERPGYGPDDIYVENKPFSLKQIIDLIQINDIDLNPNFQRHFIWDNTRQSRLIESIFLGLPLPSIYLSQYNDGRLTVVDGLQRLTTIKNFMENTLTLNNLEYLQECNGKKYSELEHILTPLRLRRFGQTQVMCFVIDYRSPSKLKFDLFKRLNTGGKPLNNQEIRNCLSRPDLQQALYRMTHLQEFIDATDNSIKDTRMEAQEAALRFMYFYREYREAQPLGRYNGNMDNTLDDFVDELNSYKDFSKYEEAFQKALRLSFVLFGPYSFRKMYPPVKHQRRSPINKLLMLTISVLLAHYGERYDIEKYSGGRLADPLAQLILRNQNLFRALTWSTNSKWNIEFTFQTLKVELFDQYLLS